MESAVGTPVLVGEGVGVIAVVVVVGVLADLGVFVGAVGPSPFGVSVGTGSCSRLAKVAVGAAFGVDIVLPHASTDKGRTRMTVTNAYKPFRAFIFLPP